jgi:hypothetical protein
MESAPNEKKTGVKITMISMIRMFIPPEIACGTKQKSPAETHPVPGYVKTNRSDWMRPSLALYALLGLYCSNIHSKNN